MAPTRIVVIDDEVEFTRTLEGFFDARGFEVKIASTGIDGVELVDRSKPDVVIVDLKMPGMDGDEILKHVRRTLPRTKVIVVTAYNDGGRTRERLLSLGAFAHFDKPLSSLRDLFNTVKRATAPPSA